jgi:hypothetical protein
LDAKKISLDAITPVGLKRAVKKAVGGEVKVV